MKICVFIRSTSRAGGGVFTAAAGLYSHICRFSDQQIHVLALSDEYTTEDSHAWGGCQLNNTGKWEFLFNHGRILDEIDPDVIHVHGLWSEVTYCGLSSGVKLGIPVVVSPHGMLDVWARTNRSTKKKMAWALYQKSQLNQVACVHALNCKEEASVREVGYEGLIRVIPNGTTLDTLSRDGQDSSIKQMCFLGRIHPKKGIDILISAWAIALKKSDSLLSQWRLVIGGWDDGGHLSTYRTMVKQAGLEEQIHFVGAKFGQDKEKFLASSDAFILPSKSEGLPVAILEAWAHSLPVLGTAETNLSDEIDSGAGVVISLDVKSLAEELNNFAKLDVQARGAMGEAGRKMIKDKYNWSVISGRMATLYRELCSKN